MKEWENMTNNKKILRKYGFFIIMALYMSLVTIPIVSQDYEYEEEASYEEEVDADYGEEASYEEEVDADYGEEASYEEEVDADYGEEASYEEEVDADNNAPEAG
ncbi:MAG: hypothetical protein KFW21_05770, partial [Spirochaetota bacterium]|nr:hypothetical protein [Spirochaetota bacterium]